MTGAVSLPRPMDENDANAVVITTSSGQIILARWPAWERAIYSRTSRGGRTLLNLGQRRALWTKMGSRFDPSREYDVELLTRVYTPTFPGGPGGVFNDILRVSVDNQTVIDASICQVHQVPMERVVMQPCSSEEYPPSFFPLQRKKFPNDGNEYLSCGSGISDQGWKCPQCRLLYVDCITRNGWGD